jgi:hypothetical protein
MFVGKEHLPENASHASGPTALPSSGRTLARFEQERKNRLFILSTSRSLFRTQKLQRSHFQELAHSFTRATNLTPAFPGTSPLFMCSFSKERKLTSLFSCIPARFWRKVGIRSRICPSSLLSRLLTVQNRYYLSALPGFKARWEISAVLKNEASVSNPCVHGKPLRRKVLR